MGLGDVRPMFDQRQRTLWMSLLRPPSLAAASALASASRPRTRLPALVSVFMRLSLTLPPHQRRHMRREKRESERV